MFGIIYTLFSSIGYCVAKFVENKENAENKKKYGNEGDGLTYIDNKCRFRLNSNNHIAMYHTSHPSCPGDYVLEDIEKNIIIKNFSKDKRDKEQQERTNEAILKGETTVCIDDITVRSTIETNGFRGNRFKDLKTGELYVIRFLNQRWYYMSVKNGHIIRETDYSKKHNNRIENTVFEPVNIYEFNRKQDEKMSTYNYASVGSKFFK